MRLRIRCLRARGATLYARQWQEVPWDCAEDPRCEKERQREMKHGQSGRVELR